MIGLLTKKLIDFFRQTDIVIEHHIPVLTSNVSDGRTVVNTTLPAIVVTVDSAPNNMVYIGGLIRDNINIDIVVMDRLVNYTLSGETDIYQWRRNLAYKLRTELFTERSSEFFKDILQGNNFLPMYRGMNNFIKQGYKEDTEEDIECWRMKFECIMMDNSTIDITYIKAKSGSVQLIDKQINPFDNNVCVREVNVDTSAYRTFNRVFAHNIFLQKINEGNIIDCSGLTQSGNFTNTFYGSSCIEELNFINLPDYYIAADGMLSLAPDIIPDKLKTVSFSPKLKLSNATVLFNGRISLEEVIGELDFSGIKDIYEQNSPFTRCTSLVEIRFTKESIKFNLSFKQSSKLSDESIQSILDGLANVSTTQTLDLNSEVYAKLTEEQKQSATDKGWTITS